MTPSVDFASTNRGRSAVSESVAEFTFSSTRDDWWIAPARQDAKTELGQTRREIALPRRASTQDSAHSRPWSLVSAPAPALPPTEDIETVVADFSRDCANALWEDDLGNSTYESFKRRLRGSDGHSFVTRVVEMALEEGCPESLIRGALECISRSPRRWLPYEGCRLFARRSLPHPSPQVRYSAAGCFEQWNDPEALPWLLEAKARETEWWIRRLLASVIEDTTAARGTEGQEG